MSITDQECKEILLEMGFSTRRSNEKSKDLAYSISKRGYKKEIKEVEKEEEAEIILNEILTEE